MADIMFPESTGNLPGPSSTIPGVQVVYPSPVPPAWLWAFFVRDNPIFPKRTSLDSTTDDELIAAASWLEQWLCVVEAAQGARAHETLRGVQAHMNKLAKQWPTMASIPADDPRLFDCRTQYLALMARRDVLSGIVAPETGPLPSASGTTPFAAFFAGLSTDQAREFHEYLDGTRDAASDMIDDLVTLHGAALVETGYLSPPHRDGAARPLTNEDVAAGSKRTLAAYQETMRHAGELYKAMVELETVTGLYADEIIRDVVKAIHTGMAERYQVECVET